MINKIEQSIDELKTWISSDELALIALNAGYENTFRDRLLFPLQKSFPEFFVRSEYYTNKNRADIAILDAQKTIQCIIELKHNYTFQLDLITGTKKKDWKNQNFQNRSKTRIEKEFLRWESSNIPLFCINLVTHFDFVDKKYKDYLKYKTIAQKNNASVYRNYSDYLTKHQNNALLGKTKEYALQLNKPYHASGKLIISIYQKLNEIAP